jgi:hypothetical protein
MPAKILASNTSVTTQLATLVDSYESEAQCSGWQRQSKEVMAMAHDQSRQERTRRFSGEMLEDDDDRGLWTMIRNRLTTHLASSV